MKILIITEGCPPEKVGGSHTYAWELAQAFSMNGADLKLLALSEQTDRPAREKVEGVELERFFVPGRSRWEDGLMIPLTLLKKLKVLLKEQRYDLVYVHNMITSWVVARFYGKKIRMIHHAHGIWRKEHEYECPRCQSKKMCLPRVIASFIQKDLMKRVSGVHVLSEFVKNEIMREYSFLDPNTITVVPFGINLQKYKPFENSAQLKQELGLPENGIVLVTVRRLVERMGLQDLLEACELLQKNNMSFHLSIIGKGPLKDKLGEQIRSMNLEGSVKLLGYVSEEELVKHYQAADVSILPSVGLEGLGISTLESLACGTPVIGTNSGATPEILRLVDSSLLVPVNQPQCIARLIMEFEKDRGRLDELSRRSVQYMKENHEWRKCVRMYGLEKV